MIDICIKCGKETAGCLCDNCRFGTEAESLCQKLISYKQGSGELIGWEKINEQSYNSDNLRNLVFAISEEMQTPRKEYLRVMSMVGTFSNIPKNDRLWFYEVYEAIKDNEALNKPEKNRLHGIALGAYCMDYEYDKADAVASALREAEDIPWQGYYNMADFYTKTRRYKVAEDVIAKALNCFTDDPSIVKNMQNMAEKNTKQLQKAESGKQEYLPNPKENRDSVRQKYIEFLASVGIEAVRSVPGKKPKPSKAIPRDQYPKSVERKDANFDTFVAFDLETTGTDTKLDAIIEIGAIRVVGGQVVETAEFTFQELVKPYKKRISDEIQRITGITPDDVRNAREMWDVVADFMKFAGNDILVGFNCMTFDSKFMERAGRYANIIIRNEYFDVMHYAREFKDQLGSDTKKFSLGKLSKILGIQNLQAHRALADAVTTARIFLKLKEMHG